MNKPDVIKSPTTPAVSTPASGSVASPEKLLMWKCKCGYDNGAPANQTPRNVVMCYQCENLFEWREVVNMQTPLNEKLRHPAGKTEDARKEKDQ